MANKILIYSNYCCIKFVITGDNESGQVGFGTMAIGANGATNYGYDFVHPCQDKMFYAQAETGYHVTSILVDGDEQLTQPETYYEFEILDIQTNHLVQVTITAD